MDSRQSNRLVQSQKLRLTAGLANSIRILRHDATGLSRYLAEQANDNSYIKLDKVEPTEWLPRWTGVFSAQGWGTDPDQPPAYNRMEAHKPGLIAHASAEINRLCPEQRQREIAYLLLNALEPSGWLGRPVADLALDAGTTPAEIEAVLIQLQKMEPTGLFARSLAECLRMQAIELGLMDKLMACVLDHLDLLARGEKKSLARLCGVTEEVIEAKAREIRSFDPKPGAQFESAAAVVREPDLTARYLDGAWSVTLNRSSLPDVQVVVPKGRVRTEEDRTSIAAARSLVRMVESRNSTILQIGAEIVQRQLSALEQGMMALVPMTMAEVGSALSLHESTVSRAVAGVSMDTPHGTFWLRGLFTASAGGQGGLAAGAIRAKLANLVANEDAENPLGDQALADALAEDGISLARRTITKYRKMLHIPPAYRRRRS